MCAPDKRGQSNHWPLTATGPNRLSTQSLFPRNLNSVYRPWLHKLRFTLSEPAKSRQAISFPFISRIHLFYSIQKPLDAAKSPVVNFIGIEIKVVGCIGKVFDVLAHQALQVACCGGCHFTQHF
jgi:hypothetical protein